MITQRELNEYLALTEILNVLNIELQSEYGRCYKDIQKEIKEYTQRLEWLKQSYIKENDF